MKLLQKGTQITWTVDNLLKEGFIKVGSKTYEEYWKHIKTDDILTLSVVDDYEIKDVNIEVTRKINGYSVLIRKPSVIELYVDGGLVSCSNSYDNLQARLFEFLFGKIPLTDRTTKEVMGLYFNIQLLFDIAKQEI